MTKLLSDMHYILRTTLLISAFCLSALSFSQAQNRVKSGIIYQPGDTIMAPLFGIETQVPVNWYGLLPQDSEVFLLTSNQDDDSRVYVRASENSYDKLQQAWKEGLVLTENLKVVVNGPVNYRGEIMYADVDIVVNGKLPRNYKAYVEAKCGDYGKCVSFFLLAGEKIFEGLKKETMELADKTKLIEPGMAKMYENFDWQKLLTGKYLMSYDQENYKNNRNTNEIWLHEDGTFKSDVERKGLIDEERGEYWGKNKGTWKVEGKGQEAKLILSFHKHDPLQLDLLIEEDKIYLNEQRYFVMYDR